MHVRCVIAALLPAAVLCAVWPAAAQIPHAFPDPDPGPDDGTPAIEEIAPAPELEGAGARQAHLDALFEELADPGNENWERTQAQIYAAWNLSGSPSMDLLARRADQAMEASDFDAAIVHLNDLTRLAPGFAEGWNKRATVHFLRDNYARSLEDIARTLTLEPRHFGAYAGLGIILDRLGDKSGALEAYRRAAAIHPHLAGVEDGIKKLTREVEGERL